MEIRHANPGTTANLTIRQRVQVLIDQLRVHGAGGRVMMNQGIANLDDEVQRRVGNAIRAFDAFSEDNDPLGEHNCAFVEVDDISALFKIDCFDLNLSHHSPNPADPTVSVRVLTVILAEEY